MTPEEIELADALASVLAGPEEHVLGPTDASLVVRALRIAAAVAAAVAANKPNCSASIAAEWL